MINEIRTTKIYSKYFKCNDKIMLKKNLSHIALLIENNCDKTLDYYKLKNNVEYIDIKDFNKFVVERLK